MLLDMSLSIETSLADVRINDGLDLHRRTGSDVGDGPASLLADAIFRRGEKAEKSGQGAGGDDDLGLEIVTGDDVTDAAKSRGLNSSRGVHKEVDETTADSGLDDCLDLVVRAVREV